MSNSADGDARDAAIIIRVRDNQSWRHEVKDNAEFRDVARKWRMTARFRSRWMGRNVNHLEFIHDDLKRGMKIGEEELETLGHSGVIEVTIPDPRSEAGRFARLFPWEYALSTATRPFRSPSRRLSVVRSLELEGRPSGTIDRILYIECVPPELEEHQKFDHERYLVGWYAAGTASTTAPMGAALKIHRLTGESVTEEGIRDAVEKAEPDIVHVCGFDVTDADNHILSILGPRSGGGRGLERTRNYEGVYVREGSSKKPLHKERLAEILTSAEKKPKLICLNIHNSASRLAPALLEAGTGAVIALYGGMHRSLAEGFFENFYDQLYSNQFGNLFGAFDDAYRRIKVERGNLQGSAVVLWTSQPLLGEETWPEARSSEFERVEPENGAVTPGNAKKLIQLDVVALHDLNYSMLHNPMSGRGQLFSKYRVLNHSAEDLRVLVEAELHAGADNFPYRQVFEVKKHSFRDITEKISVPLTSELAREVRESVRTSLYTRVSLIRPDSEQKLFEHTYPITLLPVNEWQDDEENMIWLPSFVMPRDPCVSRIVELGKKYLQTIADNPRAAFQGYQPVGSGSSETGEFVDQQVQAVWCALQHEFDVGYANPPPSYTYRSQRLRTPSQVVAGKLGTCIDLALMIAACLEYIDIKSTIFLFRGHACVGYWVMEEKQREYAAAVAYQPSEDTFATEGNEIYETTDSGPLPYNIDESWIGKNYSELEQYIGRGDLRVLETTGLTSLIGFQDSLAEGSKLMERGQAVRFECMIDVTLARAE